MPVSLATARDPFRGGAPPRVVLRVQQARVLLALFPDYPEDPPFLWRLITRANLGIRAGFTALSGSCTRALNGIARAGTKMGPPHPGLLKLGLVEVVSLDIVGKMEDNYRITVAGVAAYRAYIAANGPLPPLKDTRRCVNKRYAKNKE